MPSIVKQQELLIMVANIVLFLVLFIVLFLIYKPKKADIQKRDLNRGFTPKTIFFMIFAAAGATLLLSSITFSNTSTLLVFFCILLMIPSVIESEIEKIRKEDMMDDVILYCQNVAMLIKTSHNCFDSISAVINDLKTNELKDDVASLLKAMQTSKEKTKEVMTVMEHNYNYTILKKLNIIIMFMFYEDSEINDSTIENYQAEIEKLQKDTADNKQKRNILRIEYIFISVGCIVTYWFFLKNSGIDPKTYTDNTVFLICNNLFIYFVIFCLFWANRKFTNMTTVE